MTLVVLDTNIVLRLAEPKHELNAITTDAVDALRSRNHRPVLLPQNVYEFWAVATRPVAANGLGMSPRETDLLVDQMTGWFPLLWDERGTYQHWRQLGKLHQVGGTRSHDMRIVAAMLRNQVRTLLTADPDDFLQYDEIEVLTPESVIADR